MQRSLVTTAPSRANEPRVFNRRASDINPDIAATTFVTAITVGKAAPTGWDPQEVWLNRVHRPRLRRLCD
jgi:hypothetical protein